MKKLLIILFLGFLVLGVTTSPSVFAHHDKKLKITGSISDSNGNDDNVEGNEVRIKRRIRFKNSEFEIRTKLKVEGKGSNLSVEDSEGKKHRIRVTPERLRALMLKRFNASNVTNFSLEEIKHKNIPKIVYKFNSTHPGKFLGIFKILIRAQTIIDAEDGGILEIKGPWWAFLVAGGGLPLENEVVGNETLAEELVADDEELEEEFEVEEIEEEVDDEETNSTT